MTAERRLAAAWLALAVCAAVALAGCSGGGSRGAVAETSARASSRPAPNPSTTTTATPASTSTSVAPVPAPATTAVPVFAWSVRPIDGPLGQRMAASWRPGCPVPLEDLRYVRLVHWGFDGVAHEGELVVHADVVDSLEAVFRSLFEQRFAIRQMRLVDDFGGDDVASMAADNTSAFNCRPVAGTARWSQHSYGRAIDVNPVENPYLHGGKVEPPAGAAHLDRTTPAPGLIRAGDPVVRAFAASGWIWGGTWSSSSDLQHFSTTGR